MLILNICHKLSFLNILRVSQTARLEGTVPKNVLTSDTNCKSGASQTTLSFDNSLDGLAVHSESC